MYRYYCFYLCIEMLNVVGVYNTYIFCKQRQHRVYTLLYVQTQDKENKKPKEKQSKKKKKEKNQM